MRPIAIFRYSPSEGPGYFSDYLEARGRPWRIVRIDQGEGVPDDPRAFAGLVLMGGPMSVNDDLPWIPGTLELVRRAVDTGVPCLGHCLGGQLISKALGGGGGGKPDIAQGGGAPNASPAALAAAFDAVRSTLRDSGRTAR